MQKRMDFFRFVIVGVASVGIALLAIFGSGIAQVQQKNHDISLEQAAKYVANFRGKPTIPAAKGEYFGRAAFDKLLAQQGVAGIRLYYAKNDSGKDAIVMVGVDSLGNDLTTGPLQNAGLPCPPYCGFPSPLNK